MTYSAGRAARAPAGALNKIDILDCKNVGSGL